jgi:hypothetical protein
VLVLTVKGDSKLVFVPLGKGVINANESRKLQSRRVGKDILGIASVDQKVQGCGEGTEKLKDWLFNTRGVGLGKSVKFGSGARGAIATVVRAALTTLFDAVLPMGA